MKNAIRYTNKIFLSVLCILFMTMMQSCNDKKSEPQPIPLEPAQANRTILVYMVATNNLGTSNFDSYDFNEMRIAMSNKYADGCRLLAYHATISGVMLKEITSTGIDTLKVYDTSALSVSVERMRQVISDVKTLAPANDYGLVLWSHATGWIQDGIKENIPAVQRSYGADGVSNAKKMNITSLAYALSDSDFSFIYFDCCYMGSIEVMYEMRDCVPYMISSPTEDPADGMPYDKTLEHLFNTSLPLEQTMINAATTTFNHYNEMYVVGQCPCTMTVVRSDKVENLARLTREVFLGAPYAYNSDYNYQKYQVSTTCKYYDLDQYIESICQDQTLLSEWRAALSEAVIYSEATSYIWSSIPITHCCGLSTYILPTQSSSTTNGYNTLSWYKDVASALFE